MNFSEKQSVPEKFQNKNNPPFHYNPCFSADLLTCISKTTVTHICIYMPQISPFKLKYAESTATSFIKQEIYITEEC